MGLLTFLRRKSEVKNNSDNQKKPDYLITLEKYIGKIIEVYYLNADIPKIERAILKSSPNQEFFHIGNEEGYHMICWDKQFCGGYANGKGKRCVVALIKDKNGNEIYRNDSIPFNYTEVNNQEK